MLCEVCDEELVHHRGCRLQHRLVHALHVVEDVRQPVLQAAPEVMNELLVAHLAQHA